MAIFSDGFESGDFSAWTGTLLAGTGTATVTNTTAHHGTYSAKCFTTADGDKGWVYKTFTARADGYVRVYFKTDLLPSAAGNTLQIMGFYYTSGGNTPAGRIDLINDAGTIKWRMNYRNGGVWHDSRSATPTPATNTWFCLELKLVLSSTVGESRLYIDGTEILTQTGLNNNDLLTNFDIVRVGIESESEVNDVNHYIDCVVVADTYIGTEAAGVTVKKGSNLSATMTEMLNSKMLFSACNRFPKLTTRRF